MSGRPEFKVAVRHEPGHPTDAVSVFVGPPGQTKQLAGTIRLKEAEQEAFKQRLENPESSTTDPEAFDQDAPVHWAQYDGLSVAITRSEVDGKLVVVLEALTEHIEHVRISREGDDLAIWEGPVGK